MEEERHEAEVLEPPAALGEADRWLAETRARVAEAAARYGTHPITDAASYRDIKASRTLLRKDIAALDAERRAMTRGIEDVLSEFRRRAAEELAPLSEIEEGYKAQLSEWERGVVARRREAMAARYAEMAPALAGGLVPFDRLWAHYARTADPRWDLRGSNDEACVRSMERAVSQVADNERSIQELAMTQDERDECRADYFRTLDLAAALKGVQARREQRDRLEGLDAMRRAQEDAPGDARAEPQGTDDPPRRYAFEVECTGAQMGALMAWLRENGIHGRRRRA